MPATQITATVPAGATTGNIQVITPSGTATSAAVFTVPVAPTGSGGLLLLMAGTARRPGGTAPTISTLNPSSGAVGSTIVITGTSFTGATAVSFNLTNAVTFAVNSSTQITATVPTGASTGLVRVTTPGGTGVSSQTFTVTTAAVPTISSFSPTSGLVGSTITVNGTNLTGASVASVNSVTATPTVISSTQVTFPVPSGATSGLVRVTTPNGTAVSSGSFTVTTAGGGSAPVITNISPSSAPVGTAITLTGSNFTGTNKVTFNLITAPGFTVVSDTQINVTVPAGGWSGQVRVFNAGGSCTGPFNFTVTRTQAITHYSSAVNLTNNGQKLLDFTISTGAGGTVGMNNFGNFANGEIAYFDIGPTGDSNMILGPEDNTKGNNWVHDGQLHNATGSSTPVHGVYNDSPNNLFERVTFHDSQGGDGYSMRFNGWSRQCVWHNCTYCAQFFDYDPAGILPGTHVIREGIFYANTGYIYYSDGGHSNRSQGGAIDGNSLKIMEFDHCTIDCRNMGNFPMHFQDTHSQGYITNCIIIWDGAAGQWLQQPTNGPAVNTAGTVVLTTAQMNTYLQPAPNFKPIIVAGSPLIGHAGQSSPAAFNKWGNLPDVGAQQTT